jgi:3'-phosphoadenosine 5'-phosphosulfate sulfotransferase (PAPS reductase)/FAD synthetase
MYFVDGLSIKERILTAYERRWNRQIERVPHFTTMNLNAGTKKYKMARVETSLKNRFNTAWIALGYKKNDSMARRGMLACLENGIDERNHKLYPVAEWSDRQIMSYIKFHRLPLPVEYSPGLKRDFCVPDAPLLLYLKNNFPDDYTKVIAQFPQLEAGVWAQIN